ncbi:MAG: hypothetical protein LBQ54_11515, partial [Planctomycetaceae bacterium]|nr:hypothetical protein [Planctomycetaceae bacterium]
LEENPGREPEGRLLTDACLNEQTWAEQRLGLGCWDAAVVNSADTGRGGKQSLTGTVRGIFIKTESETGEVIRYGIRR